MKPKRHPKKAFPWSIFRGSITSQLAAVLKKAGLERIDPPAGYTVNKRYCVYGRFSGNIDQLNNC